jgi:hypothetical protein
MNQAARKCVTATTVPVALKMYAYYFRMDLMFELRVYVPRSYTQIYDSAKMLREKGDTHTAFCLSPAGEGTELMVQQMLLSFEQKDMGNTVYSFLDMLGTMSKEGYLPAGPEGMSDIYLSTR